MLWGKYKDWGKWVNMTLVADKRNMKQSSAWQGDICLHSSWLKISHAILKLEKFLEPDILVTIELSMLGIKCFLAT